MTGAEDVVVVGATGAVGSALVRSMAARGFRVVAVARDMETKTAVMRGAVRP